MPSVATLTCSIRADARFPSCVGASRAGRGCSERLAERLDCCWPETKCVQSEAVKLAAPPPSPRTEGTARRSNRGRDGEDRRVRRARFPITTFFAPRVVSQGSMRAARSPCTTTVVRLLGVRELLAKVVSPDLSLGRW
jgi:hypothetical protein